ISESPTHREYEGKSFATLAEETEKDPYEIMFDLLISDEGRTTLITFEMSERDVVQVLSHPLSMIGSDGEVQNVNYREKPHPRTYGAFARVFAQYVREGILRPEEAVRKMSSFPAQKLGLTDRGLISEGMRADLVIFDLKEFEDKATYEEPQRYAEGVKYVFVNGEPVIENGIITGLTPGQVLRKGNSNHKEA
ncbi:MAG: D-aminoacylase, partial [Deltaproteobacteria bacterium]